MGYSDYKNAYDAYTSLSVEERGRLAYVDKLMRSYKKNPSKTSSRRTSGVSCNHSYIAYRFLAKPTKDQDRYLSKCVGAARWMWNRMKEDFDSVYGLTGQRIRTTPAKYKHMPDNQWLYEIDSHAFANVQLQFERATSDWLRKKSGRPRFKKKHDHKDSFTTNVVGRNIVFDEIRHTIRIPKLSSKIQLVSHRKIQPGGTLKSVTVTREPSGRWFFSLLMEHPRKESFISDNLKMFFDTGNLSFVKHLGLDMSLPHLYVDSFGNAPSYVLDSNTVSFVKAYHSFEKKLAEEQRKLSRMQKGSKNYFRQSIRIAKIHCHIKNQRSDFLHQISARLAREYDVITIEDINMSVMKKSLRFGKSVSDNGWGFFRTLLAYKMEKYGHLLLFADKYFASSKKCSSCGYTHKSLSLSDRTYVCPKCGHTLDRDENAAINLDQEGLRFLLAQYHIATGGTPGLGRTTTETRETHMGSVHNMSSGNTAIKERTAYAVPEAPLFIWE